MRLKTILNELRKSFSFNFAGDQDAEIFAVSLLEPDSFIRDNVLYAAADDMTPCNELSPRASVVFCPRTLVKDVCNAAQSIFLELMRQEERLKALDGLDLSKTLPRKLADLCENILGNPVILMDPDFLPAAWSSGTSNQTVNLSSFASLSAKYLNADDPVPSLIERTPGVNHRLLIRSCSVKGVRSGFIVEVEKDRPFSSSDSFFLEKLCLKLSRFELLSNSKAPHNYSMQSFLLDLLEGKSVYPKLLEMRSHFFQIPEGKKFYILSVDTTFLRANAYVAQMMKQFTGQDFYKFRHYYVGLLYCDPLGDVSRHTYKGLSEYLMTQGITAGLSNGFTDLSKTPVAFLQSQKAINLGMNLRRDIHLYRFEDVLGTYLLECGAKEMPLMDMCLPVVLQIYEYDKEHTTEYLSTLAAYVLLEKSVKQASNALHVHRNTLLHRLEKLKDDFKIDFDDSRLVTKLHFSILIFAHLGIISVYSYQPI